MRVVLVMTERMWCEAVEKWLHVNALLHSSVSVSAAASLLFVAPWNGFLRSPDMCGVVRFCALVALFLSFSANAATSPGLAGGRTGFPQTISCQPGESLVGFKTIGYFGIEGAMPMCVVADASGKWTGTPHGAEGEGTKYLRGIGAAQSHAPRSSGLLEAQAMMCAADSVVTGMTPRVRDEVYGVLISMIQLTCSDGKKVQSRELADKQDSGIWIEDFPGCKSGERVSGITGRGGNAVHAIGLLCGEPDIASAAMALKNKATYDRLETSADLKQPLNLKTKSKGEPIELEVPSLHFSSTGELSVYRDIHWNAGGNFRLDHRYGLADIDGRVLVEPVYKSVYPFSKQFALVTKQDDSDVLLDLTTRKEKPLPSGYSHGYPLGEFGSSAATLTTSNRYPYKMAVMKEDGSLGESIENVTQEQDLFGNDVIKARGIGGTSNKPEAMIWVNSNGEIIAKTPPLLTHIQSFPDTVELMPLGKSPLSQMEGVDPDMYLPMRGDGLPMALPRNIVAVTKSQWGWILVEKKGGNVRYVSQSGLGPHELMESYAKGEQISYATLAVRKEASYHNNGIWLFGEITPGNWRALTADVPYHAAPVFAVGDIFTSPDAAVAQDTLYYQKREIALAEEKRQQAADLQATEAAKDAQWEAWRKDRAKSFLDMAINGNSGPYAIAAGRGHLYGYATKYGVKDVVRDNRHSNDCLTTLACYEYGRKDGLRAALFAGGTYPERYVAYWKPKMEAERKGALWDEEEAAMICSVASLASYCPTARTMAVEYEKNEAAIAVAVARGNEEMERVRQANEEKYYHSFAYKVSQFSATLNEAFKQAQTSLANHPISNDVTVHIYDGTGSYRTEVWDYSHYVAMTSH